MTRPTKRPNLPNPNDPRFLDAVRETLQGMLGERGDKVDRAVTFRDLLDSGIASLAGRFSQLPTGADPTDFIIPGDGATGRTPPPVSNLKAKGGFRSVAISWTQPRYENHAYTELQRGTTDDFGQSVGIGWSPSSGYTDTVGGGQRLSYWARHVSDTGLKGPWAGPVSAETALDPQWVADQLQGTVDESMLVEDLLTPIQAIPSIQDTLIDHGGRIQATEAALSDLLNLPAFDSNESYSIDDLVTYGGFAWRALTNMTAPSPTPVEGADWTKVGQYATFSDIIAANALAIDDLDVRVTSAEGTITSYGTSITALQNRVTDTENGIGANSLAINTLDSRVTTTEGAISSQSSAITLLQDDLSDLDGAVSANAGALSLLDNRVTSAEGTITSHSQDITQLQNDLQSLDTEGNAAAINSLTTRVEANEDAIAATAEDLTQLEATVNGNTAAIQTKAEVSAVQGLEDDVAVLSAQYTIKLDVNGRVSGIGLSNDGATTKFVVASDAVFFIDPGQSITAFNPNTNYSSMAALRNTQFVFGYATVEGQKRFAINVPAYIPQAYITSGMFEEGIFETLTVTQRAAIKDLVVNATATIWDLNIQNLIQSDNFGASTGWRVTQAGNAIFRNITARGHIEADTGYIASTLQIGGTSDSVADLYNLAADAQVLADAADGKATNAQNVANAVQGLVDNWTRPGTTLINGNRIFTGDAYVDTLQIKGQAVTFPRGALTTSTLNVSTSWVTVQSVYMVLTGAPIIITGSFALRKTSGSSGDTASVRILVGGSQVFPEQIVARGSQSGQNSQFMPTFSMDGSPGVTHFVQSPGSGGRTIAIQCRGNTTFTVSNRSISVIEAKR